MEIRKLNTLRGIAAFIVLVTHFSDTTNWLGGVLGGRAGQYGVMLFFMLSGFLMSYLYIKREFNKYNIKKYALARVGRVLPLYFLLVVLSYLFQVTNIEGLYDVYSLKMLVSHFLFIEGQDILWTIAPEIQFYIIFLVLWYIVTWRQGYLYVLIAATLALLYFTNFPRPNGFVYGFPYDFHLFRSIPYFLLGLILGKHYESLTIPGYLKSGWFVLPLLLVPLMYPEFTPVKTGAHNRMWLYFGPLMIVSLVFFSIVFLVPNKNVILTNKVGDFIGKISYSLYLLHIPILHYVDKLDALIEVKFFLFTFCSVVVAYISYRFFELPASRFVRKWAPSKD